MVGCKQRLETVCMPAARRRGRGINLRKLPILKLKADLTVSAHSEIVYEANATQGGKMARFSSSKSEEGVSAGKARFWNNIARPV